MTDLTDEQLEYLERSVRIAMNKALPEYDMIQALFEEVKRSRTLVRDLTWENNKLAADNARMFHQLAAAFNQAAGTPWDVRDTNHT